MTWISWSPCGARSCLGLGVGDSCRGKGFGCPHDTARCRDALACFGVGRWWHCPLVDHRPAQQTPEKLGAPSLVNAANIHLIKFLAAWARWSPGRALTDAAPRGGIRLSMPGSETWAQAWTELSDAWRQGVHTRAFSRRAWGLFAARALFFLDARSRRTLGFHVRAGACSKGDGRGRELRAFFICCSRALLLGCALAKHMLGLMGAIENSRCAC